MTMQITIKKIIRETPSVITLVFVPSIEKWSYVPGQFITVSVDIEGKLFQRSYSLITKDVPSPLPAITIKRLPGGKVSNYLHDYIKVGSLLQTSLPQGKFTLPFKPEQARHLFFIAGGSGIVPLFSILKMFLKQETKSQATLIYANKDQKEIIYEQDLVQLQRLYPMRLRIHHILSKPSMGWKGLEGRITPEKLLILVKDPNNVSFFFLCAPEGLMHTVRNTLLAANVPKYKIRQEVFFVKPMPEEKAPKTPSKVTIYENKQSFVLEVAPGETILDAALDEGLSISFSCCSGICNTCRAKCLRGKVDMAEDEGLSQEEKEEGYVLTCVGYPATEEVELSLE